MIDVDLMLDLLETVPDGTSIIFIGDVDQLPQLTRPTIQRLD